jgi:hypothetical protein
MPTLSVSQTLKLILIGILFSASACGNAVVSLRIFRGSAKGLYLLALNDYLLSKADFPAADEPS